MSKIIDFDNYRKEQKSDNIIIKAFDEELEIPSSPTLATMEELLELKDSLSSEGVIPEESVVRMLKELLGKDVYQDLRDKGADIEDAEWLLTQIWTLYRGVQEEELDEDDTKN